MKSPSYIDRIHILKAIAEIERKDNVPPRRNFTKYDLLFRAKRYPPKYVLAIANKYADKDAPAIRGFGGGGRTNQFLISRGFEIVDHSGKRWKDVQLRRESNKTASESAHGQTQAVALGRRYWVVSPNVMDNEHTVQRWRNASFRHQAAFMGWSPNDDERGGIGLKFAEQIKPGHIILIARRHRGEAEVVGFGIVRGRFKRQLKGFKPPEQDRWRGSIRLLSPFVRMSKPPTRLNLITVLRHTAALRELAPARSEDEKRICEWLEQHVERGAPPRNSSGRPARRKTDISISELPNENEPGYHFSTRSEIKFARKREAELVSAYQQWLKRQGCDLNIAKYGKLRCDAFEKGRNNLIEAKCTTQREHIRMAVGQLLDYQHIGKAEFGVTNMAILLPDEPEHSLQSWLKRELKISVIWREDGGFFDNSDGRFT